MLCRHYLQIIQTNQQKKNFLNAEEACPNAASGNAFFLVYEWTTSNANKVCEMFAFFHSFTNMA